ncbi:hypothetical protein RB601_005759 [Gaeumannomyces tritici]
MDALKKAVNFVLPPAEKGEDGRDQWGSRWAFIMAAMGGAVGLGNLLRFPSIVFNNHGLQFFIPYLMGLALLAIPILMLEMAVGQAFRGGCVLAWHNLNKRAKGGGWSVAFSGYVIATYYVPLIAWVMHYFRVSFISPLPWTGRVKEFFSDVVVANVEAEPGWLNPDGSVARYKSYPGTGMVGETVAWTTFTWFVVWLCSFKGAGLIGRVIYVTMALPLILIVILIGRSVSLPNAVDGVRLYFATWRGETLADATIWQEATGQIFFSVGIGMGYFTSYASYNAKYANTVQDALIVSLCNSAIEIVGAFAVFGIVGFLGLVPSDEERLSTFTSGFITYPEALAQMPGSNFFAVVFFFTLFLLGLTSTFALLEGVVAIICDTEFGRRLSRPWWSTIVTVVSFLISLMFCTEFGYGLLDAVDTYVNYLALFFVTWSECFAATTLYRYKDVVNQVGLAPMLAYNGGYVLAQVFGVVVGHMVHPGVGAGFGFGLLLLATTMAVFLAKDPDVSPPGVFAGNRFVRRFWWMAFYSGNQLTRDLNGVVGTGKNWKIPSFWAPLLKYMTSPVLLMLLSLAYPLFISKRTDPQQIFAFSFMHIVMVVTVSVFVYPRYFNVFVKREARGAGDQPVAPGVTMDTYTADIEGIGVTAGPDENRELGGSSSKEQVDVDRK